MMIRGLMMGAALTLAACVTGSQGARPFEDPAVQKLYNLPSPEYYATLKIANQVALNCARYNYDADLDLYINERRNEVGRGSLSARGLSVAIDLETNVMQRSFEAKHGVRLDSSDLCPAADAETRDGSAISAVLIPV